MSGQQGANKAKKDEVFDLEQQFILRMPPVSKFLVYALDVKAFTQ